LDAEDEDDDHEDAIDDAFADGGDDNAFRLVIRFVRFAVRSTFASQSGSLSVSTTPGKYCGVMVAFGSQ
jgi:hypothetical protein